MGTEFLSKLRAVTNRALRLTTGGSPHRTDHNFGASSTRSLVNPSAARPFLRRPSARACAIRSIMLLCSATASMMVFYSWARQYEPSADREFASRHFTLATISTDGACIISSPSARAGYSCPCPAGAAWTLSCRSSQLLPVATAPASPRSRRPLRKRGRSLLNSAGGSPD